MKLKPRTLTERSGLQCEYLTYSYPHLESCDVLVVRFTGDCGLGSGSDDDCRFMSAMISAGLKVFSPIALVLDLTGLGYEWGDLMSNVLLAGSKYYVIADLPTAVIASERNREGLTSLVIQEMRSNPTEWLFESLDQALDAVKGRANEGPGNLNGLLDAVARKLREESGDAKPPDLPTSGQ
jgi:hypothetical protein